MVMLIQELLVYLGMFAQTEEKLFHGMLRLRIGLIIQVMATELARCLKLSEEDATDDLLNLSPFEMRNLLHHLMAGEEFTVEQGTTTWPAWTSGPTPITAWCEPIGTPDLKCHRYTTRKALASMSSGYSWMMFSMSLMNFFCRAFLSFGSSARYNSDQTSVE